MPAVSVLMPVYNAERFLAPAIDSILAQTHRDFELLIVDDGSTDRSYAIAAGYRDSRIRIVRLEQNAGLSIALNEGLRQARSPLVARQDADDVSEPHRLERQLAIMCSRTDLALVGSRATEIDESGSPIGEVWRPIEPSSIRWYSLFDNPFIHTSVIFRTDVVRDRLWGFDDTYDPFSQDYVLWSRLMEGHACANLPDRLVRYRVLSSSITGALDQHAEDSDYRRRFAAIIHRIVAPNATRVLGPDFVSDSEADVMAGFILGVDEASLRSFLTLFERLLVAFAARHAGDVETADFRETLARQFDALAYRVTPPSRRAATAVYAHALRHHPAIARHLSWPRALALSALGKSGRARIASWRRGQ